MLRSFLAVVAGYVTLVLGVTSTLAILFFVARDAFPAEPGASAAATIPSWVFVVEIVSGLAVAVLGGYVCALVARRRELAHGLALAGVVLVLGIVSATMEQGMKPLWSSIGVALAGVIGAPLGAAWRAAHARLLR